MTFHSKVRDAGQLDLLFEGRLSSNQRLTLIDKAPLPAPDDFARCHGNEIAKRALEIAAVGKHSIALVTANEDAREAAAALLKAAQPVGVFRGFSTERGEAADLIVEVHEPRDCDRFEPHETSAEIAARIEAARPRLARWPTDADEETLDAQLEEPAHKLLEAAMEAMRLDDRAVARVYLVARSIAALADVQRIGRIHIAEALAYARPIAPPEPPEPEPDPQPVETAAPDPADHFWRERTEGREIVEVDPKRLGYGGGDIARSYSAQSLGEKGAVKSPFKFRGGEWVYTGGGGRGERDWAECYRLVALDAFDGPSAPYRDHDWNRMRGNKEVGAYHGMSAKHGSRDVVLSGPPVIFLAGQPEQAGLL
jgi:hypothetical protein